MLRELRPGPDTGVAECLVIASRMSDIRRRLLPRCVSNTFRISKAPFNILVSVVAPKITAAKFRGLWASSNQDTMGARGDGASPTTSGRGPKW
ncbi:hypothetical protein X977_4926 [Burkholderia pseudomallei MSHR7504]|nr:hypothetical protein X977_4926 [Burkholderia pseudomallei MSHR7504]